MAQKRIRDAVCRDTKKDKGCGDRWIWWALEEDDENDADNSAGGNDKKLPGLHFFVDVASECCIGVWIAKEGSKENSWSFWGGQGDGPWIIWMGTWLWCQRRLVRWTGLAISNFRSPLFRMMRQTNNICCRCYAKGAHARTAKFFHFNSLTFQHNIHWLCQIHECDFLTTANRQRSQGGILNDPINFGILSQFHR